MDRRQRCGILGRAPCCHCLRLCIWGWSTLRPETFWPKLDDTGPSRRPSNLEKSRPCREWKTVNRRIRVEEKRRRRSMSARFIWRMRSNPDYSMREDIHLEILEMDRN